MEGSLGSRRCRKRTQVLDGMESGVSICPAGGALVECAPLLVRGGAVWQLVGLITRRSQVQILPPLPTKSITYRVRWCLSFLHGASCKQGVSGSSRKLSPTLESYSPGTASRSIKKLSSTRGPTPLTF